MKKRKKETVYTSQSGENTAEEFLILESFKLQL